MWRRLAPPMPFESDLQGEQNRHASRSKCPKARVVYVAAGVGRARCGVAPQQQRLVGPGRRRGVSPRRPRVPDSHLGINADAQVVLHRACRGRPAAAEAEGMCDARVFEIDRPTVQ